MRSVMRVQTSLSPEAFRRKVLPRVSVDEMQVIKAVSHAYVKQTWAHGGALKRNGGLDAAAACRTLVSKEGTARMPLYC